MVKSFPRGKKNYSKLLIDLKQLITPKNDDGSIDHRYQSISNQICGLAGEKCLAKLKEFYEKTSKLESEHVAAAIHLAQKSFEIDVDGYQRKRITKALTIALKELGFKSSKVTKIINAGRFLQSYDWFEEGKCYFGINSEMTGQDFIDKLSEYFGGFGAGSLDVLGRMTMQGRKKAYRHFAKGGIRMSQKALEALQREHPVKLNERRGRKLAGTSMAQSDTTQAVVNHQSLMVMADADADPLTTHPESAQRYIDHFFQLFASGAMEQSLAQCPPSLQAHLIDEIKTGITLLEDFVSKNKTIEVSSVT